MGKEREMEEMKGTERNKGIKSTKGEGKEEGRESGRNKGG